MAYKLYTIVVYPLIGDFIKIIASSYLKGTNIGISNIKIVEVI